MIQVTRYGEATMEDFLRATPIVDFSHPDVTELASELAGGVSDPTHLTKRCFKWVSTWV